MKFAHMADVHLGAWKEINMDKLADESFIKSIDICLQENIDFLLIAGDFFDTSIPPINKVKLAVDQLNRLKLKNIPVYAIAGSHDYSPTGKTMLEVLDAGGFLKLVSKGKEVDGKLVLTLTKSPNNALITGIPGKRGMLDKQLYHILDRNFEEEGFKIFMFHTSITEIKTKSYEQVESYSKYMLPEDFDYYAGGHIHVREYQDYGKGKIVYPGPIFPCSFKEIHDCKPGFIIYDNGTIKPVELDLLVTDINISSNEDRPETVRENILSSIPENIKDSIVTLRLKGVIDGRISDINFNEIYKTLYDKGAYHILKNITKLTTKKLEAIKLSNKSAGELETQIRDEHLGQFKTSFEERQVYDQLVQILSIEKKEDEKGLAYEEKIVAEFENIYDKG